MLTPAQEAALHKLLATHKRNLNHLLVQEAAYGGQIFAPVWVMNQIREAREAIQQIEAALATQNLTPALTTAIVGEALSSPTGDSAQLAAALAEMPTDTIPAYAPLPPRSRMPFGVNPLFVGREQDLIALARTLKEGTTAAIGQVAAATGMGGIGKTNLATEFVHRYGQFFAE